MHDLRLAIPLHGKMAVRSFHSSDFLSAMERNDIRPAFFLGPDYFRFANTFSFLYFPLKTSEYDDPSRQTYKRLTFLSKSIRRFGVRTETTDLRFRESVESLLFHTPMFRVWSYAATVDILRRVPGISRLACWWENYKDSTSVHEGALQDLGISSVLTPGFGSYGFGYEGLFAREAKRLGIKVFSGITNYDNILNRGFRGFMPDLVAVWSKLMAEDTLKLQAIPASKIEITGPVQYDRFFRSPSLKREEFLSRLNLNPKRKTILFAGGVNITRYFEIYRLFVETEGKARLLPDYNLVVRPYPHPKLLESPGWKVIENLLAGMPNVYISFPSSNSGDDVTSTTRQKDLWGEDDLEELHCLLKFSDVMINIYSTISLEAAICDLPVIHMGYDLYTYGHRPHVTAAFMQQQTHNRRKLRLAAAKVASDEQDLLKCLQEYLHGRDIDRDARYEYALSECGYLDGKSSGRLADLIKNRQGK